MINIFPPGFWSTTALLGVVLFFVLGVDLLFGARLILSLSKTANRKFHIDQIIINALVELKKGSDREFDVELSLLHGWGRFVMGGLLFFSAFLIAVNLLPRLR